MIGAEYIPIYKTVVTVLAIMVAAYIDNEHLVDGDYIEDHYSRWFQRLLFIIAIGGLDILDTIGCGLLFMSMFDIMLNLFMYKKLVIKLGTTALWDLFWRKRMKLYGVVIFSGFVLANILIWYK